VSYPARGKNRTESLIWPLSDPAGTGPPLGTGDPGGEADELHKALADPTRPRAQHTATRTLASEIGDGTGRTALTTPRPYPPPEPRLRPGVHPRNEPRPKPDRVEVRGQAATGPFTYQLAIIDDNERWFLSPLLPL